MNLFQILMIAHLIGDYLLQTEFEAMTKAEGRFWNRGLLSHCLKYTACCAAVLWLSGASLFWAIFIFGTHIVLDRRTAVLWWRRIVMRGNPASFAKTFWLTILVDQIFHVLVLAVVARFS